MSKGQYRYSGSFLLWLPVSYEEKFVDSNVLTVFLLTMVTVGCSLVPVLVLHLSSFGPTKCQGKGGQYLNLFHLICFYRNDLYPFEVTIAYCSS